MRRVRFRHRGDSPHAIDSASAAVDRLVAVLSSGPSGATDDIVEDDATLIVDGGHPERSTSASGRTAALTGLRALMTPGVLPAVVSVNGAPGIVLVHGDSVVAVITVEIHDTAISSIWVVSAPEKLDRWQL
ncbi:hypothetical protein GYA93_21835 [Gordonia desulfuricans]|uniref:Uncharacterized protein n=1 Tax=Gordonia desulfuricans TaxID=89051 RepID=A0A7K3LV76_9ACTN|nr:hypothetical protein [Gordonia desulfuricans]NDK92183.1 hypothetical protein [Gordonia desulfuricans]